MFASNYSCMGKINARKSKYKGINFQSDLEKDFYQKAEKAKIPFQYEPHSITLIDKFTLEVGEFYQHWGKKFIKRGGNIDSIDYTPDFFYDTGKLFIYCECKGRANESYPFRRKLFLRYLERYCHPYVFFEPKTKKDNTEVIEIVKTLI